MKCPNCDFIDKDEAFGEPSTCPKCGAIYEKALKVRRLKDKLEAQHGVSPASLAASETVAQEQDTPTIKDRFAGMSAKAEERRKKQERRRVDSVRRIESKKVIIEDIDMPFWSMVRFMVKWVIASIPAILILILIATGVPAFIGSIFTALM